MPTRRGRVLLVAALVLYAIGRAGAIGELYALAAAALVFPVLAVAFVRYAAHRLRVERVVTPRRIFNGNEVTVSYAVSNPDARPSPPLVAEDDAPASFGGSIRFALPSLGPRVRSNFVVRRHARARGRTAVGPLRARISDPFGLAERSIEITGRTTVLVYPRIEVLSEDAPPEARGGGGRSLIHRLATQGDDFYGVRGWQDGDDLRKVHWRSTAKRGELMIRQDEVRPFPRATLFVDTRAHEHRGDDARSSLEYALSAAASSVWELGRQGFALRLALSDSGPTGARWGREAVDPLLTALALAERTSARSMVPALRRLAAAPGAGGALFAILPPPTPDMLNTLSRVRRAYNWAGAVLLDGASFARAGGRERAQYDQRLAEAERTLARAGWRVTVASASDPYRSIWQKLLGAGPRLANSQSPRS